METFHTAGGFGDLVQKNSFFRLYPRSVDGPFLGFDLVEFGQFFRDALLVALAECFDWAEQALRFLLVAEGGAQLHHGLVVVARSLGIEEILGELLVGFGGVGAGFVLRFVGGETGENAYDVAVDDGRGIVERDAANGGGGVRTDTREGLPTFRVGWDLREGDDFLGQFMEVSSSRVVA